MSDDPERAFLSRWSRRKVAARAGTPVPEPAAPTDAAAAVATPRSEEPAAPAELPEVDTLHGLESDYREFLRPEVDESLRRTALKKLFADPHFNVMDGLDIYIDDYSQPDPIPAAMLRSLNQARGLCLLDDETDGKPAEKGHAATPQEAPAAALDAGTTEHVAPVPSTTNCLEPSSTPELGPADPVAPQKTG